MRHPRTTPHANAIIIIALAIIATAAFLPSNTITGKATDELTIIGATLPRPTNNTPTNATTVIDIPAPRGQPTPSTIEPTPTQPVEDQPITTPASPIETEPWTDAIDATEQPPQPFAVTERHEPAFKTSARVGGALAETHSGMIAYRSNSGTHGLNSPKLRYWNSSLNGSWGSEIELQNAGSPVRYVVARHSPINSKIVIVSKSDDGWLDSYVCVENCTTQAGWNHTPDIGRVWSSVANAGAQRRYDLAFETASGDAVLVYSVLNTSATKDLAYKELPENATSFAGLTENAIDDTGHSTDLNYTWVRMDSDPSIGSDELLLIAFDATNTNANAAIWNGDSWGNYRIITNTGYAGGYENIAAAYSANGTIGMVYAAERNRGVHSVHHWSGTAWVNTPDFDAVSGNNPPYSSTLTADPSSQALQAVVIGSGNSVNTAYWSGSAWTVTTAIGTVDNGTTRPADFAWNPSGSTGILLWDGDGTGTTLSYRNCTPLCTGTTATLAGYAGSGRYIRLETNPNNDNVRILGARLNDALDIGSFSYNNTYKNYGDSAITPDTTTSTFESFWPEFNRDKKKPAAWFENPTPANNATTTDTSAYINITANEILATALLEWNGVNTTMNGGGKNWHLNTSGLDGIYAYQVFAIDTNDNINTTGRRNLTVDPRPPTILLLHPAPSTNTTTDTINFSWLATDNIAASVRCNLTLDGTINASGITSLNNTPTNRSIGPLAEGDHTWNVSCDDSRLTGTSTTRTFTIDKTGPTLAFNSPGTGTNLAINDTLLVDFNATDPRSISTAHANITRPDGTTITLSLQRTGDRFTANTTDLILSGRYNISATANDTLGNNASAFTHITRLPSDVIDLLGPDGNPLNFTRQTLRNDSGTVDLLITPQGQTISTILIINHTDSSPHTLVRIANTTNETPLYAQTFAIDLSGMNMSSANITFTPAGTTLFKCLPYNMTTGQCDDWDNYTYASSLTPGQPYTLTLLPNDPGFGVTINGSTNITDAYIRSGAATTNYGTAAIIRTGRGSAGNIIRGIISFNTSSIPPGVRIDNASLQLFFVANPDGAGNLTHAIHRINPDRPWTETGTTWNTYDGANPWTSPSSANSPTSPSTKTASASWQRTQPTSDSPSPSPPTHNPARTQADSSYAPETSAAACPSSSPSHDPTCR